MAPTTTTALAEEKTLPSSFVRDEDESPKFGYKQFRDEIPVTSLVGVDEVDGRRGEIHKKILDPYEDWVMFQVIDHGMDAKLISDMLQLVREFFPLPPEEKLQFDMSSGQKGAFIVYSHRRGEAVRDWRDLYRQRPEAIVYPLKIREGGKPVLGEPITFAEIYRRKMSKRVELDRLKKMAKEQELQELEEANPEESLLKRHLTLISLSFGVELVKFVNLDVWDMLL